MTALAISLVIGPWMIRRLRDFQIGQVIRQDGPADASRQGRHADDGRPADPDVGDRPDAAVGEPDERLHLDRRARDDGVRRRGFRRRLPEDRPALASRAVAPLQDGLAGRHRRRRRPRAAVLAATDLYNTRLLFPFFKWLIPDLGWFYVPVRGLRLRRLDERGQPDRRPRRPGDQRRSRVAAAAFTALAYVSGHRVFADYLLIARVSPLDRRADHLLRRAGRREPRVPLVQLVSRRDLHGRRRIARARRRARHRRAADQAGVRARRSSAASSSSKRRR